MLAGFAVAAGADSGAFGIGLSDPYLCHHLRICGPVDRLEHCRRLCRTAVAGPYDVLRHRGLHDLAAGHPFRADTVDRHVDRSGAGSHCRGGCRLSLFPLARSVLLAVHHCLSGSDPAAVDPFCRIDRRLGRTDCAAQNRLGMDGVFRQGQLPLYRLLAAAALPRRVAGDPAIAARLLSDSGARARGCGSGGGHQQFERQAESGGGVGDADRADRGVPCDVSDLSGACDDVLARHLHRGRDVLADRRTGNGGRSAARHGAGGALGGIGARLAGCFGQRLARGRLWHGAGADYADATGRSGRHIRTEGERAGCPLARRQPASGRPDHSRLAPDRRHQRRGSDQDQ